MPEYYYPDIAFLVNFFLDYILLSITKYVRRLNTKRSRRAAAAALGSLTAVLASVLGADGNGGFMLAGFVFGGTVMCAAAFGKRGIKRNLLTLSACTFVMGGMLYAFGTFAAGTSALSAAGNAAEGKPVFTKKLPAQNDTAKQKIIPAAFLFSMFTMAAAVVILVLKARREEAGTPLYPVRFWLGEESFRCMGLLDTGNGLYEPFGKKPVLLLVATEFQAPVEEFRAKAPEKGRYIPYRAVGTPQGMLLGVELNKLVIETKQEEICLEGIPAAYAPCPEKRDAYQVILHPDFFP